MYLERKGKTTDQSGDFESKPIDIKAENMDLAFQELINYSNPVGSIVREITSNCLDAHVDAGIDEAPVIRLSDSFSSSQAYVDFVDFGDGMSEEKIENIYGSLYESDKRDTNDKIGAFGIGSKSPLAYCDSYILITVHEGVKRQYWVYNHGQGFSITKYSEEQVGDNERSGTTVRVPIRNEEGEIRKFKTEIKKQLAFFRKIKVEGFDGIEDNHIVEGENFVISKWSTEASDQLCICLGEVRYDIRKDLLRDKARENRVNLNLSNVFDLNIGLKFNIGELDVTSKREDIKYTDSALETIINKLKECYKEVESIVEEKLKADTLEDFLKRNSTGGRLSLGNGINLDLPLGMNKRAVYTKYPNIDCHEVLTSIKSDYKEITKVRVNEFPKPTYNNGNLKNILISCTQNSLYHHYQGETLNKTNNYVIDRRETQTKKPVVVVIPSEDYLDDVDSITTSLAIALRSSMVNEDGRPSSLKDYPKALEEIRGFYKEVRQYIIDNTTYYHDVVPTNEELEEKKELETEQLDSKVSQPDLMTIKFLTFYSNLVDSIKFKEDDFAKNKRSLDSEFARCGTIIYGFRNDREQLIEAFSMLAHIENLTRGVDENGMTLKRCKVVSLSKQNAKLLRKAYPDKAMHVSEYMKGIHSTFRKVMTHIKLRNIICIGVFDNDDVLFFDNYTIQNVESDDISRIRVLQDRLHKFMSSFSKYRPIDQLFKESNKVYERYVDFYNKHNLWYPGILEAAEELHGFACKYPMLFNVERDTSSKPMINREASDVKEDYVLNEQIKQYVNIVPNKHVHPRFFKFKHSKQ